MKINDIILNRSNTTSFKKNVPIYRSLINKILSNAAVSPSGWNLQPWRFTVILSDEEKGKLVEIAYGQEQVKDCSAVIAVSADIQSHEYFDEIYQPLLDSGLISDSIKGTLKSQVLKAIADYDHRRENAVLNASLSIMPIVYSAEAMGFSTGIIGGFNKKKFSEAFDLPKSHLPLVLINIGMKLKSNKQSTRLDPSIITKFF